MDPDSRALRVTVTDGRGRPVRDGGLARWLARIRLPRAHGAVTVALVSDRHIQQLNRQYRNRNSTTDVLSFPSDEPQARAAPRRPRMLGDIAIATGVARQQARDAGHSYATELRVLALHGLLHLLGYDHEDPGDRGRMARVESRLRRESGLPEGLIGRAGVRLREGRRSERPAGTRGGSTRRASMRPAGTRSRSSNR